MARIFLTDKRVTPLLYCPNCNTIQFAHADTTEFEDMSKRHVEVNQTCGRCIPEKKLRFAGLIETFSEDPVKENVENGSIEKA